MPCNTKNVLIEFHSVWTVLLRTKDLYLFGLLDVNWDLQLCVHIEQPKENNNFAPSALENKRAAGNARNPKFVCVHQFLLFLGRLPYVIPSNAIKSGRRE